MPDLNYGERTAPHKAVARGTRPTGLDRQASQSMSICGFEPDHIRPKGGKAVRLISFYFDRDVSAVQLPREL